MGLCLPDSVRVREERRDAGLCAVDDGAGAVLYGAAELLPGDSDFEV